MTLYTKSTEHYGNDSRDSYDPASTDDLVSALRERGAEVRSVHPGACKHDKTIMHSTSDESMCAGPVGEAWLELVYRLPGERND